MLRDDVIQYLREQAAQPFVWGKTDCVQFAAGMVERATGVRPILPAYNSETGAKRVLVDLGGLEAAVTSFLGPAQRDLRLCGDGDIVLSAFQGEQTLGIAVPRRFFVLRYGPGIDTGIWPVDMTLAIRWWPCRTS